MKDTNEKLKIAGISVVVVLALGILVWQLSANSVPANGGGVDLSNPETKEALRKHYEGMQGSKTGPGGGPPSGGPSGSSGPSGPGPR